MNEVIYTVRIEDADPKSFEKAKDAVRFWDSKTFNKKITHGSIGVEVFQNEFLVRDRYLLHVTDGVVYLNPNDIKQAVI